MEINLIGLHGKKESGKDTIYQFIRDELITRNVKRVSFADKLKISAANALGFYDCLTIETKLALMNQFKETGEVTIRLNADDELPFRLSGREFLQLYGTEAHREVFGDSFWIDQALPVPDSLVQSLFANTNGANELVVVTDVRFENEAKRIKDLGGVIWHVIRDQDDGDTHSSEQVLPVELIDNTIWNEGDLDDLADEVASMLDYVASL